MILCAKIKLILNINEMKFLKLTCFFCSVLLLIACNKDKTESENINYPMNKRIKTVVEYLPSGDSMVYDYLYGGNGIKEIRLNGSEYESFQYDNGILSSGTFTKSNTIGNYFFYKDSVVKTIQFSNYLEREVKYITSDKVNSAKTFRNNRLVSETVFYWNSDDMTKRDIINYDTLGNVISENSKSYEHYTIYSPYHVLPVGTSYYGRMHITKHETDSLIETVDNYPTKWIFTIGSIREYKYY